MTIRTSARRLIRQSIVSLAVLLAAQPAVACVYLQATDWGGAEFVNACPYSVIVIFEGSRFGRGVEGPIGGFGTYSVGLSPGETVRYNWCRFDEYSAGLCELNL